VAGALNVCTAARYLVRPTASHGADQVTQGDGANMATDDAVIAKIFGKMDSDNSGAICEAELSAAFVGFDRDGYYCRLLIIALLKLLRDQGMPRIHLSTVLGP